MKPHGSNLSYFNAISGGGRGQRFGKTALPYGVGGERTTTGRFANFGGQPNQRLGELDPRFFGPIPNGLFEVGPVQHSQKLGPCSQLMPVRGAMMGRGGFFIHGQGKTGSEGCIVPLYGTLNQVLQAIMSLRARGRVFLRVEGSTAMDLPELPTGVSAA
jgi:hypothetical protein